MISAVEVDYHSCRKASGAHPSNRVQIAIYDRSIDDKFVALINFSSRFIFSFGFESNLPLAAQVLGMGCGKAFHAHAPTRLVLQMLDWVICSTDQIE